MRKTVGRLLRRLRGESIDFTVRGAKERLRRIDAMEPELERAGDGALRERGRRLRERTRSGVARRDLVEEGIALVREVGRRVLSLRLHDSQVLAAVELDEGKIVELATGEGKTLAAVAPAWLGSLAGGGLHVLTFNDYLAARDASWMGPIYSFLEASVGFVQENMGPDERRRAYACDVTYATAKQAGFDYLRDGLALALADRVHRPLRHAIVDEADSLLIDEARVPLVLAGGTLPLPVDPRALTAVARRLERGRDFEVDDNARNVGLTDEGIARVEREIGVANLHDGAQRNVLTALNLALHAEALLRRDVDYIVRDGRIEVVDEFTGRVVSDRRWPDGLHPALEAKEGLEVRPEGSVLASVPLQHFFRAYPRLAGMTATAVTATEELNAIYGLAVAVIPPHRPCIRRDDPDATFTDRESKRRAIVEEVARLHASRVPVLVGTANVSESESLAGALAASGVPCRVLNAKHDAQEARIVAEAGRPGAVTISTNMAGRGTDIRLGGSSEEGRAEVAELGGLRVIGTNRHESRRIDDQLRGRAGRQGDPGSSRFFVSLEDDLIERYGIASSIAPLLDETALGRIDSRSIVDEIDRAQRIVEGQNFDIRRTLWNYSTLVEQQRRILGELRERVLEDPSSVDLVERLCPERHAELVARCGPEAAAAVEQRVVLVEIDRAWSAHLSRLADVRENIHMHYLAGFDWFGGLWGLRKTPLDVFHESAIQAFDDTRAQLEEAVRGRVESLELADGRVDLEGDAFRGPSSTWTYLVSDTPFESTIARLYRGIARGALPDMRK